MVSTGLSLPPPQAARDITMTRASRSAMIFFICYSSMIFSFTESFSAYIKYTNYPIFLKHDFALFFIIIVFYPISSFCSVCIPISCTFRIVLCKMNQCFIIFAFLQNKKPVASSKNLLYNINIYKNYDFSGGLL